MWPYSDVAPKTDLDGHTAGVAKLFGTESYFLGTE